MVRLAGPVRMRDEAIMPSSADPPSNEKVRAAVQDLIERSLLVTLRYLNLTE
jgi:hypothetical protein